MKNDVKPKFDGVTYFVELIPNESLDAPEVLRLTINAKNTSYVQNFELRVIPLDVAMSLVCDCLNGWRSRNGNK